jgi:hypothetical protein
MTTALFATADRAPLFLGLACAALLWTAALALSLGL